MSILDRAELLLRAENYSGSGDWLDESGNGHDAQFGSTSGADTNDPLYKAHAGTDYAYLPGTSGNYFSRDDVNLLDADTAHMYQSVGTWSATFQSVFKGITADTSAPFADSAIEVEAIIGADRCDVSAPSAAVPISSSTAYAAGVWVKFPGAITGRMDLYGNVGGRFKIGDTIPIPANTWTFVSSTGTSGGSDTTAYPYFRIDAAADSIDIGDLWYMSAACWRAGSDATFVPSLRIVGDLDIETKVTVDDIANGTFQVVLDNIGTNQGFQTYFDNSSQWTLQANGETLTITQGNHGISDGDTVVLRMTAEAGTGFTGYVDGVSVGTGAFTGPNDPSGLTLYVGEQQGTQFPFGGDIYYVTVRDGIDGPIVAHFDPSNYVEATSTTVVPDPTGVQEFDVNRSATGLVSTLVDRDMFLLSTDDYFTIADHADLDFDASTSFTAIAVATRTLDGADRRILGKRTGTTGWELYFEYTFDRISGFLGDGSTFDAPLSPNNSVADNVRVVAATRADRATDQMLAYADGVNSSAADIASTGDASNAQPLYIGRWASGGYMEGQIVAVALFREALTDTAITIVGRILTGEQDPTELHGDALFEYILANETLTVTDTELVGALNELNGTSGIEYAEARGTYLDIPPAG